MSYTKKAFEDYLFYPVKGIQKKSIENVDLTDLLEYLDCCFYIFDRIKEHTVELESLCNEISSDILSSLYSAVSGFYRLGMVGLRSILELSCNTFYYIDHKIEYHLYKCENLKADKYVHTLVNEHSFYKTKYIKAFNPSITEIQTEDDSVSNFLSDQYRKLCDIVHGRFQSLTKVEKLKIEFDHSQLNKYKLIFTNVISAIAVMYILRYGDISNSSLIKLAKKIGVIKHECL